MSQFWCAARLMSQREAYATHCLGVARFETYLPRLREQRTHPRPPGRGPAAAVPRLHLHRDRAAVARRPVGAWVAHIIMDGMTPAKVPDRIIDEIRGRERGGLVELPKPQGLRAGDRIRITSGPFQDHLGLFAGQARPRPCRGVAPVHGRPAAHPAPRLPPWRRCSHDPPPAGRDRVLLRCDDAATSRPASESSLTTSSRPWTRSHRAAIQAWAISTGPCAPRLPPPGCRPWTLSSDQCHDGPAVVPGSTKSRRWRSRLRLTH